MKISNCDTEDAGINCGIKILIDFVQGQISGLEFETLLRSNNRIAEILQDDSISFAGTYIESNPFDYILTENFSHIGGLLNIQGAIALFLKKKGIAFTECKEYSEKYQLILDSQPKYVDAKIEYIENEILPVANGLPKNAAKKALKEEFKRKFQYQTKPPRWIQSPEWPIIDNHPLFFVDQVRIIKNANYHDDGAFYNFINLNNQSAVTITQIY